MGENGKSSLTVEWIPTNKYKRKNGVKVIITVIDSVRNHQWMLKLSGWKSDTEQDIYIALKYSFP